MMLELIGHQSARRQKMVSSQLPLLLAIAAAALITHMGRVAADANAGRNKAEACAACHGANGISQTENTPSLASQPDQFLQWQLVFFRSGARKNEVMEPIAEHLSNEDVRDLAAYFTSLKPADSSGAKTADDRPELAEAGKNASTAGRCTSCHGDNFAGSKAVARIARQREEYIIKVLQGGPPDRWRRRRDGGGACSLPLATLRGNRTRRCAMDRKWMFAGGGLLLLGIAGVALVTAEPSKGPVFIAGDQPVTEDQVRQKLQSDGWSNVQVVREGRYLEAIGSKSGQTTKVAIDAQTGRLRADDDDED